jgi:predicted Zn-dependent peptidase
VLQNSSRPGIIGQLEFVDLHGLPADYLNGYVKRVYAVTPQQIQDMAKKYIQDDKATIVIVGDRKVIEDQVKAFGPVK